MTRWPFATRGRSGWSTRARRRRCCRLDDARDDLSRRDGLPDAARQPVDDASRGSMEAQRRDAALELVRRLLGEREAREADRRGPQGARAPRASCPRPGEAPARRRRRPRARSRRTRAGARPPRRPRGGASPRGRDRRARPRRSPAPPPGAEPPSARRAPSARARRSPAAGAAFRPRRGRRPGRDLGHRRGLGEPQLAAGRRLQRPVALDRDDQVAALDRDDLDLDALGPRQGGQNDGDQQERRGADGPATGDGVGPARSSSEVSIRPIVRGSAGLPRRGDPGRGRGLGAAWKLRSPDPAVTKLAFCRVTRPAAPVTVRRTSYVPSRR